MPYKRYYTAEDVIEALLASETSSGHTLERHADEPGERQGRQPAVDTTWASEDGLVKLLQNVLNGVHGQRMLEMLDSFEEGAHRVTIEETVIGQDSNSLRAFMRLAGGGLANEAEEVEVTGITVVLQSWHRHHFPLIVTAYPSGVA
eukprot:gb/GFBE01003953.1/.p1 GENE.gb/GFBE01003953.1/~~gb/GFBE01003953.1/.p1  ORF type:complete len:146 (+),score=17.14 gb/GFBE01003953.1/:1-438(+)